MQVVKDGANAVLIHASIVGWQLCRGHDAGGDCVFFRDHNDRGARQKRMQRARELPEFGCELREVGFGARFGAAYDAESVDHGSRSQKDVPSRAVACLKRTYDFPSHPFVCPMRRLSTATLTPIASVADLENRLEYGNNVTSPAASRRGYL
jgi:hypothetical protein